MYKTVILYFQLSCMDLKFRLKACENAVLRSLSVLKTAEVTVNLEYFRRSLRRM